VARGGVLGGRARRRRMLAGRPPRCPGPGEGLIHKILRQVPVADADQNGKQARILGRAVELREVQPVGSHARITHNPPAGDYLTPTGRAYLSVRHARGWPCAQAATPLNPGHMLQTPTTERPAIREAGARHVAAVGRPGGSACVVNSLCCPVGGRAASRAKEPIQEPTQADFRRRPATPGDYRGWSGAH